MSLLLIEGFEGYGTTNGVAADGIGRGWPTNSQLTSVLVDSGRTTGGKSARFTINNPYIQSPSFGNLATIVVGFAFKYTSNNALNRIVAFYEGANEAVNLRLRTDGEWEIYRGTALIAGPTTTAGIGSGAWGFIELKATIHNSAGSVELRIGGVTVLSATGIDTQPGSNAYVNTVRFVGHNSTPDAFTIDDVYILDTSGSVNNDFLGNRKVVAIFPSVEGDQNDFTPSTGTDNSTLVSENPADDTSYVESGTTGHKDLYQYDDVPTAAISGIQITTVCKETDAGSTILKTVVKSGSTESADAGQVVGSTTLVERRRIVEVDPDTGVAWTPSGLNAAQFGMEIG